MTFLKEVNLYLENLERIAWGEVVAVHAHPRHLHPNESRVGVQNVPDAVIGVVNKNPGPLLCMLIPVRVLKPFVLLTNEQQVLPPLPGR